MSFGVSDRRTGLEWRGTSPSTVFAQRRNLAGRRSCACWPTSPAQPAGPGAPGAPARRRRHPPRRPGHAPLVGRGSSSGTWSRWARRYGRPSVDFRPDPGGHVCPLLRTPRLATPARPAALADHNRRFADLRGRRARPLQREGRVRLGTPVEKIRRQPDGVELVSVLGAEQFDHVVVATHSDQALRLLSDPDHLERSVLGAIAYQPNGPPSTPMPALCPATAKHGPAGTTAPGADADRATLTYYVNRLQGIISTTPLLVTLNQDDAIDPERVIARMDYEHPVLGAGHVAAQRRRARSTAPGALGSAGPTGATASTKTACAARSRCARPWEWHCEPDDGAGPDKPGRGRWGSDKRPVRRHLAPSPVRPGTADDFSYRVAMPLIDLDGVEAVTSAHPLWSNRSARPRVVPPGRLPGRPGSPLAEAVRDLVGERSGSRPEGKSRCWPTCVRGAGCSTPSAFILLLG